MNFTLKSMGAVVRRWWPLALALLLLVLAWRGASSLRRVTRALQPVATAVAAPLAHALHKAQPVDEAEDLRAQLAVLKLEYQSLREAYDRDRRRGGKLSFPHQRLAKLKPVGLLARDPSGWFKGFRIDAGEDLGLRQGAGVLNAYGVIGRLAQVGPDSSYVELISDPACHLSARLTRANIQCAVYGDGRGGCMLQHLGGQDDVRVGDKVETGAGSLSFPSGVPIGTVTRLLREEGGLRLSAELAPAAPLNQLDALVVWVGEPKP
jgi:rod shape-determining protein MreC